jgi:cell division protein FtsZ
MTKIKIIGLGGSGGNALLRMKKSKVKGVELVAINTDYQDLKKTKADVKLRIGKKITQGLGTGMKAEIGREAAMEAKEEISQILKEADMVFLCGGLGGGTCSGAAPVVAEISKNLGILTLGIFTLPFSFEGISRRQIAIESKNLLKEKVDSLIIIENDRLFEILDPQTKITQAFFFCDEILREAVKGISDLIISPGIININFADIKTILKNSGTALFGIGKAKGEKRGEIAAKMALNSPLLNLSPKGAKGILFNVSGGDDLSLSEIEEIGKILTKEINPQANVIFGATHDKKLKKGEIKVTLIATGF